MNLAKNIIVATALTGVWAMAGLGAVQGGESAPSWKVMNPLHAISFDVGSKHVLSYFLSKNGLCELTMMVTDRPLEASEDDELTPLSTARIKAEIDGGKTVRIDTAEGKALAYACAKNAQVKSVLQLNQVAITSPRRAR